MQKWKSRYQNDDNDVTMFEEVAFTSYLSFCVVNIIVYTVWFGYIFVANR